MTLTIRLAEPHEERPLRCGAKRARNGRVTCEAPALHDHPWFHAGRDRLGRWITWVSPNKSATQATQ